MDRTKSVYPDKDVRHGVDMNFSRIEDAIRSIKKDRPLSQDEKAYCVELSGLLAALGEELAGR